MSSRPILVLGELSDAHRAELEAECTTAGFDPTWTTTVEAAAEKLSSVAFDSLLIDLMTPGAASVCVKARGKLQKGRFPIVALVEEVDDAAFTRAFRAGADDVVLLGTSHQISRRLLGLPRPSRLPPGRARGEALVIDPDRARGEVLERTLADAGYRVDLARDELAAKLNIGRPHVKLVVIDASIPNVRSLFDQSRKKGSRSVWLVRVRPEHLGSVSREFGREEPVAVLSSFGPPDDVVFESNRLLDDSQGTHRTEPRLLHGTAVGFGTDIEQTLGFTYNVSPTGLFVRTLAVPQTDALRLELKPPGCEKKLSLQGQVVWRRAFGPAERQSAPPGFAVRLTAGQLDEWSQAFRNAYAELLGDSNDGVRGPSSRPLRKPLRPKSRPLPKSPEKTKNVKTEQPLKAPIPPPDKPREPLSSVEEMLSEALSTRSDTEDEPGSVPLWVNTFEIDRPSAVLFTPAPSGEAKAEAPASLLDRAPSSEVEEVEALPLPDDSEPPGAHPRPPPRRGMTETGGVKPRLPLPDVDGKIEPRRVVEVASAPHPPRSQEGAKGVAVGRDPTVSGFEKTMLSPPVEPPFVPVETLAPPPHTGEGQEPRTLASPPPSERESPGPVDREVSRRRSRAPLLGTLAVAVGIVAGAFFALRPATEPKERPPASERPKGARGVAQAPVAVTPEPQKAATTAEPPSKEAPSEVSAPAEAETPEETREPEPPPAAPPPGRAHLFVRSDLDTRVFVHGVDVGKTNETLVSRCGARFVRLGTEPGKWQSDGMPVHLRCGELNRLQLP